MLELVRIVLVRPIRPGNIGAACRALKNMGLSDLVLVAPACDHLDPEAEGFAARAKPLLKQLRIVPDIASAIDDCVLTLAASAKRGMYRRQAAVTAAEGARQAVQTAAAGGRVAVVFGPEDHGLTLRELLHFDRVLEIPGNPEYPVLNLAAAVMVVCYELYQAQLEQRGQPAWELDEPPADARRKAILFDKLFAALDMIGFFRGQQNPDHLKFALRRVLGRLPMTINEVDVLIGMSQQIRWYVEHYGPDLTGRRPGKP